MCEKYFSRSSIAAALKLPVFLNMIGLINNSSALTGLWVAAFVGLLTNIFLVLLSNPVYLPYALTGIISKC